MTLGESLSSAYAWAVENRIALLLASLAIPIVGTALARIGKGGKTDADGRAIASVVVGVGIVALVLELLAIVVGTSLLGGNVVDADLLLLLAPVLCVAGCVVGVRLVFPLSQLGSVQTFRDIGAFVGLVALAIWLFSKFRGWGLFFVGDIAQLAAIGVLGWALLRRLYARAFGSGRDDPGGAGRAR